MGGIVMVLTAEECEVAEWVGEQREKAALAKDRPQQGGGHHHKTLTSVQTNQQGAAAEMACARLLDCYWEPLRDRLTHGDVGVRIPVEVKWTGYPDGGLRVHDGQSFEHPYVLVTGMMPTLVVAGFAYGPDIPTYGYRENAVRHRMADGYLVPQPDLKPVAALIHHLNQLRAGGD